jgi:predicted dinucleotide-binding enzyme
MRYGVLGTGVVGRTLGTRLVQLGDEVCMGGRAAGGEAALEWVAAAGGGAREGSFTDAAEFGEVVICAVAGAHALSALEMAGAAALRGKVLVDVSNPIAEGTGFPPALSVCNTDSVGEQIQRAFPEVRVVKSLNTVNCAVMVDPASVPGPHNVFVSGEDADAKQVVASMLSHLGWPEGSVIDLGGIEAARGTEMYLALWLRLMSAVGTPSLNVSVHVAGR